MARYDTYTKILHGKVIPEIYHPRASVGQVLLYNFFKNPERVIQVSDDDGIALTCLEMSIMMTNIAKNLFNLGFKCGDVAGLLATNTTYVAPAIFGSLLLGLVPSPLDTSFNVDKIVQIYRKTRPSLVFCDYDMAEKLISALDLLQLSTRVVILNGRLDGYLNISDLLSDPMELIELPLDLGNSADVCCVILCTSGSSGMPKLARVSHAQALQPFSLHQFPENTFSLNFSSLYWLTGFSNIIFQALNLQKRLITTKPFSPELCCDLIEKYKLKHVFLMPPHIILFVESPRFKTADLSSIKVFTTGGLYTSEQLRKTLQSCLINGKVCVALGMTEVGGIIAETDPHDPISSSVGKPAVNTQIKILIDDGTIGGIHEIGEILVRKPMKFLGYLGSLSPLIQDEGGWIHTGDMGFIDELHELHVMGQRTYVIKNFYNEIYPNELEELIERLPGVCRACVFGMPDPEEIEVPSVFVIKHPQFNVTENEIRDATSQLDRFKRIREVFFVESLPTAPSSGKLQRRLIKEMAEQMTILRTAN